MEGAAEGFGRGLYEVKKAKVFAIVKSSPPVKIRKKLIFSVAKAASLA